MGDSGPPNTRQIIRSLKKSFDRLYPNDEKLPAVIIEDMGWRYAEGEFVSGVIDHEDGSFIEDKHFRALIEYGDIPEELANNPNFYTKVVAIT